LFPKFIFLNLLITDLNVLIPKQMIITNKTIKEMMTRVRYSGGNLSIKFQKFFTLYIHKRQIYNKIFIFATSY